MYIYIVNLWINISKLMGVSENVVYPIVPNGFADHEIPFLNGYFIGNIPNIFRQSHIDPYRYTVIFNVKQLWCWPNYVAVKAICRISEHHQYGWSMNLVWMEYEWDMNGIWMERTNWLNMGLTPSGRVAGNSSISFHGHLHIGNIISNCCWGFPASHVPAEYQREHDDKHWNFEALIFRLLPRSRQLKQLQMGISPGIR